MFLRDDLAADLRRIAVRHPIEFCHQFGRPEVRRGVAMALQAPGHVERLYLFHLDHLVHPAMATHATHAGGNVRSMIEIDIVRKPMDFTQGIGSPVA